MRGLWRALAAGLAFTMLVALPALLPASPAQAPAATAAPAPTAEPTAAPTAVPAEETPYRAVWVSYLEWQNVDFSSAAAFTEDIGAMLDDIAGLGATVVLAHVRPFGDALYPSALYPFSHLCTGTQGQSPGFDPLALLLEAAHARGLQLEAWVNPYRLQAGGTPAALCADSLAARHPDWVKRTDAGLYLDPANAQARQYIADGLEELCARYALDGIHFDDYFYPATDPAFDADEYAAYQADGGTLELTAWRCAQIDALVSLCWQTVHRHPGVRFGIAPQGDPDANLTGQYSDAARWLAEPGYVDYLMPQLYWGREYPDENHRLDTLAQEWAALPRAEGVKLYAGLAAYRIGEGETGGEWRGGGALAAQAGVLAADGFDGVGLYRYDSLFAGTEPALAARERAALAALWGK